MRGRVRAILGVTLVIATIGVGAGEAHTGWKVQGSFVSSPRFGCGTSPTCLGFVFAGRATGVPCDPQFAIPDGPDASVVPLPPGLGNHRARLSWTTTAGPVNVMSIGFLGPAGEACADVRAYTFDNENFPPAGSGSGIVVIHPAARAVYVNAETAANVTWKLEGIDD